MMSIDAYAEGIADDIPVWEEDAARDLAQLLINHDGLPSPSRAREAKLGLLVEMVMSSSDPAITIAAYSVRRAGEAESGRAWPSGASLCEIYGSWIRALQLAASIARGERRGISKNVEHLRKRSLDYTRADLIGAIRRCKETLGYWPRYSDYTRWSQYVRDQERTTGGDRNWVPSIRPILTHFGSWKRALELATKEEAAEQARSKKGTRR